MKTYAAVLVLMMCFGCTSGDGGSASPGADTPTPPVDTIPPPADTLTPDTDAAPGEDATAPECQPGGAECGDRALCWEGTCVPPWRYGAPTWGTCPDEPLATAETLAEKAAFYDDLATRIHIHPELKWITSVTLGDPDLSQATLEDVTTFHSGENDGLWSALYLTSQAYRYAATGSEEALATIKLLLEGEVTRMAITGVPGVFTRQYIPPGIDGIACPTDDAHYVVDVEKDDNRWVKIQEDGCVWVVDNESMEWTGTDHCGLDEFAGWCWLDNVSQDEYAGHMLALGALLALVDDAEVQAVVKDLLIQVGTHLMENDLTFVDWDGRVTEHGWMFPMSLAGTPGFLAAECLSWFRMGIEAEEGDALRTYYDECLLQKNGPVKCLDWPVQTPTPFTDYLDLVALFVGEEGCITNFNNVSMVLSAFQGLLMFEHDPELRPVLQEALRREFMESDSPKAAENLGNPWYNFAWAASKPLGPDSDGPAYQAVEDGICSLRQFPASQATPDLDNEALYPHFCDGRLGKSLAEHPIPEAHQCPRTFSFWKNPYRRGSCTADPTRVQQPGDYLLAYWMGRYYGFIPEGL